MAAALCFGLHASAQVSEFGIFDHFGANLGVGTEGISIGVAAPVTNYLEVGLGINFMPAIKPSGNVNIHGGGVDVPQMDANGNPIADSAKTYDEEHPLQEGDFYMVSAEGSIGLSPGLEYMTDWIFTPMPRGEERDRLVAFTLDELKRQEQEYERGEAVVPQQPVGTKRFCNKCGAPLIEGNAFCTSCGQRI